MNDTTTTTIPINGGDEPAMLKTDDRGALWCGVFPLDLGGSVQDRPLAIFDGNCAASEWVQLHCTHPRLRYGYALLFLDNLSFTFQG